MSDPDIERPVPRAGRPQRPVDPDAGPVARLAWELRELRQAAGAPTYRTLARRAHYAASTLAEAAKGERLPTLAVTLAYVRACGGDVDDWEERWRDAAASTSAAPVEDEPPCPYPGLTAYREQDAEIFFGRGESIARAIACLEAEGGPRLLAVFGASGSGKSSLVRAGVLAGLDRTWQPCRFTPGAHPLVELAHALAGLPDADLDPDPEPEATAGRPLDPDALTARPAEEPGALDRVLDAWLSRRPSTRLVLVVDQFEEAFTLCADHAERDAFLRAVADLARAPGDRVRVVLVVRADFYAHCSAHPDLVVALREGTQLPIGPPTREELREIVTAPARRVGVDVDADLVADLIADAADRPGSLPLLAHALRQTWYRREGHDLRAADYHALGGVHGAVAQTAEGVYAASTPERRLLLRGVFVRLTALGEGAEDTRRRVYRAELAGLAGPAELDALLEVLTGARLIVLDRDTVEVAHEAVIRAWPRLAGWLLRDREDLRIHRRLTEAAGAWDALGRDRELLYRGDRLADVRERARRGFAELNDLERAFLAAGVSADRRRTRLFGALTAVLVTLLALTLGAGYTAVRAQHRADDERDAALSGKVAANAADLRPMDPATAAQLSLAAYRLSPTDAARGSLLSAFTTPFATRIEHDVNSVVFTPDGATLITGGDDRTIRLWDVRSPHRATVLAELPGQPEDVESLTVDAGGRLLVSANYDGTVRLWDVSDPRAPVLITHFAAHDEAVFRAVPGPDARLLVTAGAGGVVRLWDISDRRTPTRLSAPAGHTATVGTVAFGPDGRVLVTGSEDGDTRLWDVGDPRDPRPLGRLPDRAEGVTSVALSTDGRILAVAGQDHQTRLWDVGRPGEPVALASVGGHTGPVQTVAFSADGTRLATAGWDFTTRLWDVSEPTRPRPLATGTGHTNTIWAVAFSPDGRILASAGADHTVRLTDVSGPVLAGHDGALSAVAFGPDGRTALVGSEDFTARLWDVGDPDHPRPAATLSGHTGQIKAVGFAPSGRIAATGSIDTTIGLWDVADPRHPIRLSSVPARDDVRTLAFGSGGDLLASAGGGTPGVRLWDVSDPARVRQVGVVPEGAGSLAVAFHPRAAILAVSQLDAVHLWDVADPRHPRRLGDLVGHTDGIDAVAFAPDGRVLATAGFDGTARLWDVGDPVAPRPLATLTGHVGGVSAVAFASDGRTLATSGVDGTARLWGVGDPRRPRAEGVLAGHTDRVHALAFGPDGRVLVTASEDRTARLWFTDVERVAARVCALAHPRLTREEWNRYFPGVGFHPPCPSG
ncbi:hypothetical protein B4N89_10700 [Embleya scabrispora]|uniref:HTH cro/C1-type domain-containing protein n=1 Tax=Embleya scabrispora TaxID=159449 RepID=A0A1T3NXC6_9ACTN|nr:AAA family ATPase [Embleya scabrispora]OPC81352.1 hypothetical protein B4N89_10700 [Embleya scabrispora]